MSFKYHVASLIAAVLLLTGTTVLSADSEAEATLKKVCESYAALRAFSCEVRRVDVPSVSSGPLKGHVFSDMPENRFKISYESPNRYR